MMWGAGFAGNGVTPVVFLAREKAVARPAAVVSGDPPGARWGKPSAFTHSAAEPNDRPAFQGSFNDEEVEVNGYEHSRQWENIRVRSPDDESQYFDTEGVKSVTFYIGSRVLERMEDKSQGGPVKVLQPTIETVHEYLRFTFTLAGGAGTKGRRGEADPTPTPDAPNTDPIRFAVKEGRYMDS